MAAVMHKLTLPGAMIEHGFWLYVWRIASPEGELLYVGRIGDNSSANAQTPFTRMGQHLGKQKNQNAVRKHVESRGISPEECDEFDLVAFGPLFPETKNWDEHVPRRDVVAALEKALADGLRRVGYDVLNTVNDRHALDSAWWAEVRRAFTYEFPKLAGSR
jgi:hypothetical protein